ncbi:hypothetical protein IWX76_001773 [Pedobacter sp. CAN_A7]
MKIIDNIFYNIICASEIIQRRIWGYGDSVWGDRVLRTLLSFLAIILWIIPLKLSIPMYISSIIALTPFIYYFFFIGRESESKYELAFLKFTSLPKWVRNTYIGLISFIFVILPFAIILLIFVDMYA